MNDDTHFSREVYLLDDILPNYVFIPRKIANESTSTITKLEQCENTVSNSSEDLEKCKKFSKSKKPTNLEDKMQKVTGAKSEENSFFEEEENQDFGIKGLEIKDGIKDDFENSVSPSPLHSEGRGRSNSIPSEEKLTKSQTFSNHDNPKENFRTVPGNVHTLLIGGLESEEHYLVTIKACVNNNISKTPCGAETSMHASPITLSIAKFFKKYNISIV